MRTSTGNAKAFCVADAAERVATAIKLLDLAMEGLASIAESSCIEREDLWPIFRVLHESEDLAKEIAEAASGMSLVPIDETDPPSRRPIALAGKESESRRRAARRET